MEFLFCSAEKLRCAHSGLTQENTERDMKKINLAAENNVKLIFWPYWIKITNSNFQKFCKDNSL